MCHFSLYIETLITDTERYLVLKIFAQLPALDGAVETVVNPSRKGQGVDVAENPHLGDEYHEIDRGTGPAWESLKVSYPHSLNIIFLQGRWSSQTEVRHM